MDSDINRLKINTLELHYYFTDVEHKIDALVQNRCEHELLSCMKEISKYFEIDYVFETELTKAGGIRKYFKLKPKLNEKDEKKILIDVRTAVLTALITGFIINPLSQPLSTVLNNVVNSFFEDKELKDLEKEKLKEEIKALQLDNKQKQNSIDNNAHRVIIKSCGLPEKA
ncbi:hypothetical protein [Treponema sp.]|uniref:hypothetical protein n=1 Tax=Treponema sp. TaxID=166 RepID=UPI003FD8421C